MIYKQKNLNLENNNLSQKISLLGNILGKVIKDQEGNKLFEKIEEIRVLSKLSRGKRNQRYKDKKFIKLKSEINALKAHESKIVSRAFGQFLNFANLAESLNSVNQIHDKNVQKISTNELILLEEAVDKILKNKLISMSKFYQTCKKLKIELVLTAHPTEVKRRTIIQKYRHISDILENPGNDIYDHKSAEDYLHEEITSIWKTDELKRTKPTPVEEAKWGLAVIEDSLWDALPRILARFDKIVKRHCGKNLPLDFCPITFGSWMGGDRDGNPYVTGKITEEVVLLSRWMAANLYENEFTKLIQELSMHECSASLQKKVGKTFEPYRVYLRPIRNKLQKTQKAVELHLKNKKSLKESDLVNSIDEIILPLIEVYKSLCSVKCEVIAKGPVADLIRRSYCFGLNLAKLDIRQDSLSHQDLINKIFTNLGIKNYQFLTEEKKVNILIKKLKSKKPLIKINKSWSKKDIEVWTTFQMIAKIPRECLGAYIISMASKASDVLAVLFLQKNAGVEKYLRVVPLFETLKDLERAHLVMKDLYNIPWYLKCFKNKQEVMIGYSDSSKDAGKFSANWAQYCAQENLQKISKRYRVELNFFHGRGGSIGRGGGPVYAALLSQPPGTVNCKTRVTEQGEVIQQKFNTESLAEYNLGTYIGAVLEATLVPPISPKLEWIDLMNKMSNASSSAYRNYLTKDKDFIKYYETVTPQKTLSKLFIGSRPSRRKATKKINDIRAIPWVFAWTQIRIILPAWLGTLEALTVASRGENKKTLQDMLNNWPFFYEMMDMLDMILTKTDQRIIKFYEECLADKNLKNIGNKLRKQLIQLVYLNKKLIPKKIRNQRKAYRKSIRIRNTYAETLNLLQANIMKKLRQKRLKEKDEKILRDALLVTITGISAAMKNTG